MFFYVNHHQSKQHKRVFAFQESFHHHIKTDAPENGMTATRNDNKVVNMASNEAQNPTATTEEGPALVDETPAAMLETEVADETPSIATEPLKAEELPPVQACGLWCLVFPEEETVETPPAMVETPVSEETPLAATEGATLIEEALPHIPKPPARRRSRHEKGPALADEALATMPEASALDKPLSIQSATVPGAVPEAPSTQADAIVVPLGDAESTTTKSSPSPATRKNKKKLVCLGLLLLAILIIAAVVGVVVAANKNDSSNDSGIDALASQSSPGTAPTSFPTDKASSKPSVPPTSLPTTSPTLSSTFALGMSGAPSPPPTDVPTATPTTPTLSLAPTVQRKLFPYVLQNGNEFNDSDSYQSKALARTEQQNGIEQMADSKIVQYYALFCIYTATYAVPNVITDRDERFESLSEFPGWIGNRGWTSNDLDPCPSDVSGEGNFEDIECQNGKVVAVKLNGKFLTGVFPSEVTLLASDGPAATGAGNLQTIDLFSNPFLYNNADNSWMESLGSSLANLYFKGTSFAGDLPQLPSGLKEFDCSYSLISGGLVNENIQNLQKLEFVDFSGCAFNQTIPSMFASLPNLQFLYLSDSFLFGDLSYMDGMQSIVEHWVDMNPDFGGTIPAFIGDLTTLKSFSVTQNNLVGPLPVELGKLFQMESLWLYGNQLTGTIPTGYGSGMARIKALRLESNQLNGTMPASICSKRTNAFPGGNLQVLGGSYSNLANCDPVTRGCCNCESIEACDLIGFA